MRQRSENHHQIVFRTFIVKSIGDAMAYIAAHVHVRTPDLTHYPLARGYKRANMQPRRN